MKLVTLLLDDYLSKYRGEKNDVRRTIIEIMVREYFAYKIQGAKDVS